MITLNTPELFFLIALLLYALWSIINRICVCFERRAYARYLSNFKGDTNEIINKLASSNTKNIRK